MLTRECRGSVFDKEIRRHYDAVNHKKEHVGDISRFEEMKKNLQSLVDENEGTLLLKAVQGIGNVNRSLAELNCLLKKQDDMADGTFSRDEIKELEAEIDRTAHNCVLDCGWINFRFLDDESAGIAKNASVNGSQEVFSDGSFGLNMPYNTQSTTVQRCMADGIVELAENEGIKLGYTVVLD